MKIRIKSNAIRYRLTRTDVAQLAGKGYLEEKVDFTGQPLVYAIQLTDDSALSSAFKNNAITLFVPRFMVSELTDTDKVGFENSAGQLHLLVEKDFTCLDNVAEDQSDNYPNPLLQKTI
ncbi:DUF7009 family protein [Mucilaginibacter sp.]|uniref:DUF7009 family protein n=1 Tax=Mucilaginibacter sp. TaxID=1882438 RepID=UPI003D103A91